LPPSLLEKPMAPDEAACRGIVAAVEKAGVMLAVGHVLRYTPYTRAVKEIVDSGQLGDIMSVQHLEPVGFWHQAHAFVRGPVRGLPGRSGLSLFGPAVLRGPAPAGRARLAAERRY
jgi:predicted dehydrogenase